MDKKNPRESLLEKIFYRTAWIIPWFLLLPMPMKIDEQSPVIKRVGLNVGMVYVGYDFDGDGFLNRVDGYFNLGDHTIPSFSSPNLPQDSPEFQSLQSEYIRKIKH